jgi:hypothetical protein
MSAFSNYGDDLFFIRSAGSTIIKLKYPRTFSLVLAIMSFNVPKGVPSQTSASAFRGLSGPNKQQHLTVTFDPTRTFDD